MSFVRSVFLLLALGWTGVLSAADDLWLTGNRYSVAVQYGFVASNVVVRPAAEFNWKGAYAAQEIRFEPYVEFETVGVTNIGADTCAYRVYGKTSNTFTGASKGNWKWVYDDKDVNLWEKSKRALGRGFSDAYDEAMEGMKDVRAEPFALFAGSGFSCDEDKLLLMWRPDDLLADAVGGTRVKVFCEHRRDRADYVARTEAPKEIEDAVNAEMRLLSVATFGGKLLRDVEEWKLDAATLNGLLFDQGRREGVRLGGTMTVRSSKLDPAGTRAKLGTRFTGRKVVVKETSGAYVEIDGRKWHFSASPDAASSIELWYDGINQALRYADIRIRLPDYEGRVPNPQLARMVERFKGTMKGDFIFTCRFWCKISSEGER